MGKKRIKRKRKRSARTKQSVTAAFRRRIERSDDLGGTKLVTTPEGLQGMSAAVLDLADPLLEDAEDYAEARLFIQLAMLAWNVALYPEDRWEEEMGELLATFPQDDPEMLEYIERVLWSLIARKIALFPENDRIIVNYDLSMTDHGPYLQVASAVSAELYHRYASEPNS